MVDIAHLVLADGSVYQGQAFGALATAPGEVVFNTSMTGYQEVLTDPSYAGQLVVLTYPLIGNYGINTRDIESKRIQVAGLIVREHCIYPSHGLSTTTLTEYLSAQGIPAISGVDTRSIARRIRNHGVMMGILSQDEPEKLVEQLKNVPQYNDLDLVRTVSTDKYYYWGESCNENVEPSNRIVVSDCGLKLNILRILASKGCEVMVLPSTASAEEILALRPSGILWSPGPGDPALLDDAVKTAQKLIGRIPIMGICLGHQVLARALGGKTFKLKFGHRGANHPVKDLSTGQVYITAQNHGYAVDADSLPADFEISHVSLNDGTVEGLRHRDLPILTIQYHSEASPGPKDSEYLFDQFLAMVKRHQSHVK